MGFKAIRESWNRNIREMGDQDAIREKKKSFWKAKQGLSKTWDLKTKIGLILGRRTKRERGKEEKRKRKKKKRRREGGRSSQGMETNLDYGFYEIWHGFLGLYDDYLISKSRVFIEWYPKLRFLEIKVG